MPANRLVLFIRESFIIFGWVALWRPMELLLYDWYPVKTDINLFYRLEHSYVRVIIRDSKILFCRCQHKNLGLLKNNKKEYIELAEESIDPPLPVTRT